MAKNNTVLISKKIKKVLEGLPFTDRLPQRQNVDKKDLKDISDLFGKKTVTPNIVGLVIGDFAFREVLGKVDYKHKGSVKLKDYEGVNVDTLSKEICEFISGIPYKYHFLLHLPKCEQTIKRVKFAYNVGLFSATDKEVEFYAEKPTTERVLASLLIDYQGGRSNVKKGDVLLLVTGRGYVSDYSTIKLDSVDPLYVFKVVVGIYVSLGILKRDDDATLGGNPAAFTYDVHSQSGKHIRYFRESTEDNQYLSRMVFDTKQFEPDELAKILKKSETQFDYANSVLSNLFPKVVLSSGKTDKHVVRQQRMLKNGAYWFYESLKKEHDHERAIFMTTAFDSLLPLKGTDDKKEFKAEMIANSIAKNSLEAHSIREHIIKLYALRNDIVHGSKEVSSLEQYGSWEDNPSQKTIQYSVILLGQYLQNRIYFVNSGLAQVTRYTKNI